MFMDMILARILAPCRPIVCLLCVVLMAPRAAGLHRTEYTGIAAGVAELPQDQIDALLRVHNEGRAEVEPSSANMNRVAWSHDLYAAAKEKVETCEYIVDIPEETGHHGKVVQFTGISRRSNFDLVDAVDTWLYVGKESYDFETDTCSRDNIFCRMYKLFTWAPMRIIGCAHTLCADLEDTYSNTILQNTYYWKCNYFPVGNLDDANPYTAGTPCIECPDKSGWCNNELDMCDSSCVPQESTCDCLYSDTCTGVYTYDPVGCSCTCNHADCADDEFVCILKCGDPAWVVVDHDQGICHCDCPPGYQANEYEDVCNDIDECANASLCAHFCENTLGSYSCSCMTGFELDADQSSCVPFYQIGRHDISLIGAATTTEGPYTTATTEEHTTEETTAPFYSQEMATEEVTTTCSMLECGDHGTYDAALCACDCDEGFAFSEEHQTCKDIDECDTQDTGCKNCENLPGSFHCLSCEEGYELNNDTERCDKDVCKLGQEMFCSNKGFLDEEECKCVCYSGYKGRACSRKCVATEQRCWPKHVRRVPTDPSQCIVFCPECECEGYPPCSNNGTLARAEGFQYVRDGTCRCYCPVPWSGELCTDCNLECHNGGTYNEADCSCTCPNGWFGVDCRDRCLETSRLCTSRTLSLCGEVDIIDLHCPIMCSICTPEK